MLNALISMTTRLLGVANTLTDFDQGMVFHKAGDFERAAPLLKNSAEAGYINGAAVYGSMLLLGQGIAEDGVDALKWLTFAADEGHLDAKSLLGMALATGKAGVKQDMPRAVKLLTECAERGDAKAAQMLAIVGRDNRKPSSRRSK